MIGKLSALVLWLGMVPVADDSKIQGPDGVKPSPSMPSDGPGHRPKPRSTREVDEALAGAPRPPEPTRRIRLVLVAGKKDHGPGEHDYPAWQKAWSVLFSADEKTEVGRAREWPSENDFKTADVMVFFQHGSWNEAKAKQIDAYLARGGGLVYVHWAIDGGKNGPDFARRIGLAGTGTVAYRHGPAVLDAKPGSKHPVMRNIKKLELIDETYWKMTGELAEDRVLATAVEDGAPRPQLWSLEHGKGRVFVSIPGHYSWTFDDPLFRVVLLRAVAWSAHEPVDRFNALVLPGANIAR